MAKQYVDQLVVIPFSTDKKVKEDYWSKIGINCITGIYVYDNKVFDIIDAIKPSERGEIEVTDINNEYIKSKMTNWCEFEGNWTDAGTWESYKLANSMF